MKIFASIAALLILSLTPIAGWAQDTKPVAAKPEQSKTADVTAAASHVAKPAAATADCGCKLEEPKDVLADVNGVKISAAEVENEIKDDVAQIERQVIAARSRELDLEINSMLLDQEAAKRGEPPSKLIDQEVISKVVKPTEADAKEYYDKNKGRISGEFKDIKDNLIQYLLSARQRELAEKYAQSLRAANDVKVLVKEVTPPHDASERDRVFATVNGRKITSGDIEDSLKPIVYNAQLAIYRLRKDELDLRTNDVLLRQQADKEKITTQALLDREVASKTRIVAEADARAYYDKNKQRMPGSYDEVRGSLLQFLQRQEDRQAATAYAAQLRKAAKLDVLLKAPRAPVYKIATDDRPAKGPDNAPVTIVEFTDFQCPSCAREEPILRRLLSEYGERVRLVVRDFPLKQHENSFTAAVAAEAAHEQGKYWEYTDLLFTNQSALSTEKLKEYADRVGLDRKKFDSELESNKFADLVQRDLQDGMKLGIDSTPGVFVNGEIVEDKSYESLKAVIDKKLNLAKPN